MEKKTYQHLKELGRTTGVSSSVSFVQDEHVPGDLI
jgi:hypothetical protein